MRKSGTFVILLLFTVLINACTWNNEEDLYPQATPCDTLDVSYADDIAPIMNQYCNSCHNPAFSAGGIITDSYNELKKYAADSSLVGSVKHEANYSPMPQGMPKLDSCDIKLIEAWVNQGTKNN